MEGDWSSREGRLGSLDPPDYCVPERDLQLSNIHLSQVSLDGGYGGSEACSSEIFQHCQQPSYAHSEGYYSYVSSTDSITPFIDRLKRELEFTEAHDNSSTASTKWEESDTDEFREKDRTRNKEIDSVWHVRGAESGLLRNSDNGLVRSPESALVRNTESGIVRSSDNGHLRNLDSGLVRSSEGGILRSAENGLLRGNESGLLRTSESGLLRGTEGILIRNSESGIARASASCTDLVASYRQSTKQLSPPVSSESGITYLSKVPYFHNASYESVNIDHGSSRVTRPLDSHSLNSSPATRLWTDSPIPGSVTKPSGIRSSEIARQTKTQQVRCSDRDTTEMQRPCRLTNGSSCEPSNSNKAKTFSRDTPLRSSRMQSSNHSVKVDSSGSESNISTSSKGSSEGFCRNDSVTSSIRSQPVRSSESYNTRIHSTINSNESSHTSKLSLSQTTNNESANIARSSRVPPPQRHLSQSVLYLSADHRKLFPISTYQPEPPRVVGAVSVSERVTDIESRFGGLKALQKKALLSFYQRHQAGGVVPPPPPRRASSASDYLQLKCTLETVSNCSGQVASGKDHPTSPSSSLLKDNRHLHSRSCGSLSGISGPMIVGRSISVDDWVPARPPKGAHLRPRPPSPEPPPPPSPPSPPQQYSDEPLPPPPGPDELPLHPPNLPSRHPSPGPQVPTNRLHPGQVEQNRAVKSKSNLVQSKSSTTDTDTHLALDNRPQKLSDPPTPTLKTNLLDLNLQFNTQRIASGILDRKSDVVSNHKDVRLSDSRTLHSIDNVNLRNSKSCLDDLPQYHFNFSCLQKSSPTIVECQPQYVSSLDYKDSEPVKESTAQSESTPRQHSSDHAIPSDPSESLKTEDLTSSTVSLCSIKSDPPSSVRDLNSPVSELESLSNCNQNTVEPIRKSSPLSLTSPTKSNLSRPPSRENLSPCKIEDDNKKNIKDETRIKQVRRLLRKTSFRCSEKIQESIESLQNSIRASVKDSEVTLSICSDSGSDSTHPVKLCKDEVEPNCIAISDKLSATNIDHDMAICGDLKNDEVKVASDPVLVSPQLDSGLSVGTLQQKKEELVTRLSRKLSVLRAEAAAVAEETSANDELGEAVVERVSATWGPREASRLRSHVADLGRLTALLLTLTTRLARADNALLALSSRHPDKGALEVKRDRLAGQLEEARRLKEKVDKRNETVTTKLRDRLSSDEYTDFMHFVSLKSKLLLDSREIADKIKLGEEQLQALQMTLSAVT